LSKTSVQGLNAAVCIKREAHRKFFMDTYGDYCDIRIEEENPERFLEVLLNTPIPIHVVFIGEEVYHPIKNREEYREMLRQSVYELTQRIPQVLVHIHIHKDNIGAYTELMELGNVYDSIFNERGVPSRELIEERLHKHTGITLEQLKEIRRSILQRRKEKKSPTIIQMKLNDYEVTNDGGLKIADPEENTLPLELSDSPFTESQENISPEEEKTDDRTDLQIETPEEDKQGTRKRGRRKKENPALEEEDQSSETEQQTEEEIITLTLEMNIADDLPYGVKEQAKILVQSAVSSQGRYFKIKQSRRTGVIDKSIALISLYPRTGSSFVANNFAIALGQQQVAVGVLEAQQPMPQLLYRLGGESSAPANWENWYVSVRRNRMAYTFANQTYTVSYIPPGRDWYSHNVYWFPYSIDSHVEDQKGLGLLDSLCVYFTADKLPILFIDLSHDIEAGFQRLVLEEVDEVWVVVEPDLPYLHYHTERIKQIASFAHTKEIYFVINKVHDFHNLESISRFLSGMEPYINPVPLATLPYADVFAKAEEERTFAFLMDEGRDLLMQAFYPLFERVLTQEALDQILTQKKRKILSFL